MDHLAFSMVIINVCSALRRVLQPRSSLSHCLILSAPSMGDRISWRELGIPEEHILTLGFPHRARVLYRLVSLSKASAPSSCSRRAPHAPFARTLLIGANYLSIRRSSTAATPVHYRRFFRVSTCRDLLSDTVAEGVGPAGGYTCRARASVASLRRLQLRTQTPPYRPASGCTQSIAPIRTVTIPNSSGAPSHHNADAWCPLTRRAAHCYTCIPVSSTLRTHQPRERGVLHLPLLVRRTSLRLASANVDVATGPITLVGNHAMCATLKTCSRRDTCMPNGPVSRGILVASRTLSSAQP